jgi:hypothetical protein
VAPPSTDALAALGAETRRLSAGTELWRVYFRGGDHPSPWCAFREFGPAGGRFDHHEPPPRPQGRRILYAADTALAALAEVFQDARLVDRHARSPWLVAFRLAADLDLLNLTGTWPERAGCASIGSGPPAGARAWSRALHEAFPAIHGLYYVSSTHASAASVALYERAEHAVRPPPTFHRPLADPALRTALKNAARTLGYGLV